MNAEHSSILRSKTAKDETLNIPARNASRSDAGGEQRIRNDRGLMVRADGAPGSQVRVRCEWPQLIAELSELQRRGKRVTSALRLIRKAGARGLLEVKWLLLEAGYPELEASRGLDSWTMFA